MRWTLSWSVSGANFYAPPAGGRFVTDDYDLFLPGDPENLVRAWAACDDAHLELWLTDEPLDRPQDRWLAATHKDALEQWLRKQHLD